MNKKALTIVTIAAMLMSVLLLASTNYLPTSDAPTVNLTLHDPDGVKTVSVGETAEYTILVENEGTTNGHVEFSQEGSASGWRSTLSHEVVQLQPGDSQIVSLYVSPTDENAEPYVDVNVRATRGDNVTIVHTTTYLDGTVQIKRDGETNWTAYSKDTELGEGDDLRTDPDSRVQVLFKQELGFVLYSGSEIHITHMNELDGDSIYEFHLTKGKIAFWFELPTANSTFTLRTPNGARVVTSSTQSMMFWIEDNGDLLVFEGTVPYYPPPSRAEGDDEPINITEGQDGSGDHFDRAMITYDNDVAAGILTNSKDETIGFDNSRAFVGNGDLSGFVFRFADKDQFHVFGTDIQTLDLEISKFAPGTFDLVYTRFAPDDDDEVHLRGFVFEGMSAPSEGTISFTFKEDQVTLSAESKITYDFGVRYKETQRFYLNGMYTESGQGNIFKVINFVFIQNEDVNAVQFGRDKDNDGTFEDDIMIHTGQTGDSVYEDLEDDDDGSGLIVLIIAIVVVLLVVGAYFIISNGPVGSLGRGLGEDEEKEDDGPAIDDGADLIPPMKEPETEPKDDLADADDSVVDDELVDGEDDDMLDEEDAGAEQTGDMEFPIPPIAPISLSDDSAPDDGLDDIPDDGIVDDLEKTGDLDGEEDVPGPEDDLTEEAPIPQEAEDDMSEYLRDKQEKKFVQDDWEKVDENGVPIPIPEDTSEDTLDDTPYDPSDDVSVQIPTDTPAVSPDASPEEIAEEDDPSQIRYDEDGYVDLDLDLFPPEDEPVTPPPIDPDGKSWKVDGTEGKDGPGQRTEPITREEILGNLQKVREQKEEMESIEAADGTNEWWNDWESEMKKDIQYLESKKE